MSSIVIHDLEYHYDTPFVPVFEELSLSVDTDWRTALVGRNGTGKTTLLRLIEGGIEPGRGEISVPVTASYFPFHPRDPRRSTLDVLRDCIAPFARWESELAALADAGDEASLARYGEILERFEEQGGYEIEARIEREFAALGMEAELLRRGFETLSGGERTRALIVALFLRRDAFPLIDEPTNHLDLAGRELLGDYLARQRGFILVSHDRHFLDLCADHVLSLDRGGVRLIKGAYSSWKLQMELEREHAKSRREKLQREIRSLERAARQRRGWSNAKEREKFGAKADRGFISHRAAKQMKRALASERKAREKLDEKRGLLRKDEKERKLKLRVDASAPATILTIEDARIEIAGRAVVAGFSLTLRRGERAALIGPNGSGKTTLLRAVAGEITVTGGTLHVPARLKVLRSYQRGL